MLYVIGRVLQLAGMGALILGMAGNLSNSISVTAMYQFTIAGIALFIAGYWIQQAGGKK
jgi:hypothetical protein